MTGRSHTLRVPIEEAWTPNVHVQVDLVGAAPRTRDAGEADPEAAAAARVRDGHAEPLRSRRTQRTLAPGRDAAREGARAGRRRPTLDVDVQRRRGQAGRGRRGRGGRRRRGGPGAHRLPPARSARGLLRAARGRACSRPPPARERACWRGREDLTVGGEGRLAELGYAGGVVGGVGAACADGARGHARGPTRGQGRSALADADEAPAPIRVRTDFAALALFAPAVPTDAHGPRAGRRSSCPTT